MYIKTIKEIFFEHTNFEWQISLPKKINFLKKLLKKFPTPKYKIIQIVGTNGKGSCVYNIAKYLTSNNIKVGTFTSPHIITPKERISISLKPIPESDFCKTYKEIKEILKEDVKLLTTFEILFFMAIHYFNQHNIDIGIFETGLGGRYDAVSSLKHHIFIITHIHKDHTQILGKDISAITYEKIAPLYHNDIVISSPFQAKKVKEIIVKQTKKLNARLYLPSTDEIAKLKKEFNTIGEIENHSITLKTIQVLKKFFLHNITIPDMNIYKDIVSSSHLPCRKEVILNSIIIDGAHNINSLIELNNFIKQKFPYIKQKILFIGFLKDKNPEDFKKFTNLLAPKKVFLVRFPSKRSYKDYTKIKSVFKTLNTEINEINYKNIINHIKTNNPRKDVLYIITGSFILCGKIRKLLLSNLT